MLSDQDVIELEMAIRAFRVVVDVILGAELFIYGVQILTKDLGELISLLDLDDNIFIKNETVDMNEIYRIVAGSIFIKQNVNSEMQMIQSLLNGCPVISYNFNYVVNEIIIDQKKWLSCERRLC